MQIFYSFSLSFLLPIGYAIHASDIRDNSLREHHFAQSTSRISQTAQNLGPENVSLLDIFGAGGCSEIPLEVLARRFDRIRLYDSNIKPCLIATANLDQNLRDKIEVIDFDLSHGLVQFVKDMRDEITATLVEELFEQRFSKKFILSKTKEQFAAFLNRISETTNASVRPDLLVSSLVSSQILAYNIKPLLHAITYDKLLATHMRRVCGEHREIFSVDAIVDALLALFSDVVADVYALNLLGSRAKAIYFSDTIPKKTADKSCLEEAMIEKIRQTLTNFENGYLLVDNHSGHWPYYYEGDQDIKNGSVEAMVFWHKDFLSRVPFCAQCGETLTAPKRCSRCKAIRYCSHHCQREHWKSHKADCQAM